MQKKVLTEEQSFKIVMRRKGILCSLVRTESACSEGDPGAIPGPGRSPGIGNSNPLQYSCLENPMDGGAWRATVHGVAKSQTWLSDRFHTVLVFFFLAHFTLYNQLQFHPSHQNWFKWASLIAQLVKNLPAMQETPVLFLGQEVTLEKG